MLIAAGCGIKGVNVGPSRNEYWLFLYSCHLSSVDDGPVMLKTRVFIYLINK